jgi:uncharacterized protein
MRFEAGHPVRVEFTKWGGRPHYVFAGVFLGEDEHGEWLGHPAGTRVARPGRELSADLDWVTLVPRHDAAHVVTFNPPGHPFETYVDIATPPEWDGDVLRSIDLDLDVIRARDERGVFIDDQDEFEEHQLAYGYPPELISLAEESAERVYVAVAAREAPYDGSAGAWLTALAGYRPPNSA